MNETLTTLADEPGTGTASRATNTVNNADMKKATQEVGNRSDNPPENARSLERKSTHKGPAPDGSCPLFSPPRKNKGQKETKNMRLCLVSKVNMTDRPHERKIGNEGGFAISVGNEQDLKELLERDVVIENEDGSEQDGTMYI